MKFQSSDSRQGIRALLFVMLLLGTGLGLGIGYWLGRSSSMDKTSAQLQQPARADRQKEKQSEVVSPSLVTGYEAKAGAPDKQELDKKNLRGPSTRSGSQDEQFEIRHLTTVIRGSLYSTLAHELTGRDADILSAQIGRILVWWLDATRDVLKGDEVSVSFQAEDGPGKLRILAFVYKSSKLGKTFEAVFFKQEGAKYGRYYDDKGVEIEKRLRHSPIDDYEQITELMNLGGRRHHGVDFKTDVGTPVVAPFLARVMRRNWKTRRNGNCLHVRYINKGIDALFLHLSEILVKPGEKIEIGTIVAKTGNTGRSTAPHLHYELHGKGGRLLNPFKVFETYRRKLNGQSLERFFQHRKVVLGQLRGHQRETTSSGSSEER